MANFMESHQEYMKSGHKISMAILILLTSSANYVYNMIIYTEKRTEKILPWTEKYFFESGYNQRILKPFRHR